MAKVDPLHDVKEEILNGSPRLNVIDRHEETPSVLHLSGGVVHCDIPAAFEDELKHDHYVTEKPHNLAGSVSGFMALDPLHDLKQEIESNSPRLKHVETGEATTLATTKSGDVVKSDVPKAFREELENDHDIVKNS